MLKYRTISHLLKIFLFPEIERRIKGKLIKRSDLPLEIHNFRVIQRKIKKVVSLPIITAGRINTPELAEKILQEKKADLIGLARMIWIDPDWVRKASEGRSAEIIQCKKCDSCMQQVMQGQSLICASWSKEKRLAVKRKFGIEEAEE